MDVLSYEPTTYNDSDNKEHIFEFWKKPSRNEEITVKHKL